MPQGTVTSRKVDHIRPKFYQHQTVSGEKGTLLKYIVVFLLTHTLITNLNRCNLFYFEIVVMVVSAIHYITFNMGVYLETNFYLDWEIL